VVTGVLIVATAAWAEMRAQGWHTVGRRLNHRVGVGAGEPRLLFGDRSFDGLSRQNEWNEDGFAPPARIRGQPRQSVAAVDQFFNGEEQAQILYDPYYNSRPAAAAEAHAH